MPGQLKIGVSSKQDLKDLKNGIQEPYTPNTEPSTYRTREKGSDQQLRASAATGGAAPPTPRPAGGGSGDVLLAFFGEVRNTWQFLVRNTSF